jgi:hypothetical protein
MRASSAANGLISIAWAACTRACRSSTLRPILRRGRRVRCCRRVARLRAGGETRLLRPGPLSGAATRLTQLQEPIDKNAVPRGMQMRRLIFAFGLVVLALSRPTAVLALGEAAELEHARANARAGGPVSERDKELLERYGCLSGTNSAFCRELNHRSPPHTQRRRTQR